MKTIHFSCCNIIIILNGLYYFNVSYNNIRQFMA